MILSPHLDYATSPLLPAGHLVVSDTLTAPSTIVVYHLIIAAKNAGVPVIWVDFRQDTLSSLSASLRRLGSTLPKDFVSLHPSPLPSSPIPLFDPEPTLKPTYKAIMEAVGPDTLVILDGLSELARMAFPRSEITRFVRAVIATRARVVSTLHADHLPKTPVADMIPSADGDLLEHLLRISDSYWRVSGLATGRSGDVSGEISAHVLHGDGPRVSRDMPLQFRLEVSGVKVFPKGTGRGFL